jgi:hypothetical protein
MRVRAGVGLGDRERVVRRAGAQAAQPAILLLVARVPREDRAGDAGGDEQRQQRTARRADLLLDHRELEQAQPAAVVLRGDIDADEAVRGQRLPELGRRLTRLAHAREVRTAEAGGDVVHGAAQHDVLFALDELDDRGRHFPLRSSGMPAVTRVPDEVLETRSAPPCSRIARRSDARP